MTTGVKIGIGVVGFVAFIGVLLYIKKKRDANTVIPSPQPQMGIPPMNGEHVVYGSPNSQPITTSHPVIVTDMAHVSSADVARPLNITESQVAKETGFTDVKPDMRTASDKTPMRNV